jgi:hypothetical protein
LAINEGAGLPEYQKQLGHPITSVMTTISGGYVRNFLQADGIFQNQAQIDASPVQRFSRTVKPGDIKYKDINNDGVIDNLDLLPPITTSCPNHFLALVPVWLLIISICRCSSRVFGPYYQHQQYH